ncbi:unnamed protein product [Penicillium manginii]
MESIQSISFGDNNHGFQIKENHGSIHAEFHPPERPETPPSPLSTVPFPRDPDFVHRLTLLDQIYEKGSVPASRVALVGLGGVGKSQLAIEYTYQIRDKSPTTWVFWVHASNEARFQQSFRDIADQIKLRGRQDPKANIFQLVENWLRDQKSGHWICILDNVDDEFLCLRPATRNDNPANAPIKPLLEYIPRNPKGSTIFTTRSREIALRIVDFKGLVEVKPMERSEALELLQKRLGQTASSQESQQLTDALDCMPLAIIQAGSYIRNRAPRYSVTQYLSDFQRSDREAIRLLKKEVGHVYRDWEAKNSILVTWQISFDYLRQTKPSAAELLSLMSFFDRQGIPDSLVQDRSKANDLSSSAVEDFSDDETSESESDIGCSSSFDDNVATLKDYSFISISEDGTSFTMHRLVQLSMRAWLKSHGQVEQWREKFIRNLSEEFPTGEHENWEKCQVLYPHVKCAMSQKPLSSQSRLELATLLYNGAWYASESGKIEDTGEMASKSRKDRVKLLGVEDKATLDSTTMLARTYREQGQWEEAEQLEVQVMETCKRKLGQDNPDTLWSIHELALTYRSQGRWEKAEQLFVQVIETRKKLGQDSDDPGTLNSMHELGLTYWFQGRWEEAEQLFVQVIENHKELDRENLQVNTLSTMHNLASTFLHQGRWEEAKQLFMQVINARNVNLGNDHPETLRSMAELASTYYKQGQWEEAEQVFLQVIDMQKIKLSEDHPDTLKSMSQLVSTYWDQGRLGDAEQLNLQVIEGRKSLKLSEDHPDMLTSMHNMAAIYVDQLRWKEAEKILRQVIETRKIKLGEDHPDTLTSMGNLASIHSDQGRLEEAEQLRLHTMESRKRKLGEYHPDTLNSMANLATTYFAQGQWEKAEQLDKQLLDLRKSKLGEDHPETLSSMVRLASTWKYSGHDAKAVHLLRHCLIKQRKILGSNHPQTLSTSQRLLEWETEKLNIAS